MMALMISLTVTHAFESARESILPLFDSALQSQRSLPEATAMDLFVRLHGMLFTRIQLDDLPTVMSRFLERLEEDASLDGVSRKATITQVDWMLMATTNITALLQYGSGLGIIRKALAQEGAERRRQHASAAGEEGEEDDGRISPESDHHSPSMESPLEPTLSFSSALELSFAILDHCLQHPRRLQGMTHVLNPYITLSLTFMATLFRQSHIGNIISTGLPWVRLVDFFNTCPEEIREEARLINGAPLPEDWCIRGMEWVGRRVYERGFWKAKGSGRGSGAMAQPKIGERFSSEMDVLLANFDSAVDTNEGVVDEIDGTDLTDGPVAVNQRRWRRVAWAAGIFVKHVEGLELVDGKVVIRGVLADKLAEVEAERLAKLDLADIPPPRQVQVEDIELESESEDEDPDLAVLRVCPYHSPMYKADVQERRRHLRSLVNGNAPAPTTKSKKAPKHRLQVVPGYTMLVFDTNVLLSSLSLFSKLVESGIWSIVVPLPVVTELDGLSKEPAPLGPSAKQAVQYLESRIRTHSLCLKIQTTKGNYLSDLLIRTESHDNVDERTMDDRILNIAAFQQDHFVDRSSILGGRGGDGTKVVLVTFDRNLRLKARARGVDAADEKEMAGIMGKV
jgi:protein SMG6